MTKQCQLPDVGDVRFDTLGRVILPRDRFFDPWLIAGSELIKSIVNEAVQLTTNYEQRFYPRKRKRKEADQATFETIVEAVLCDMMVVALEEDERGSAIPLSNKILGSANRYRPPCYREQLRDVVKYLASPDLAFVELRKGEQQHGFVNRGQRTLIWPGGKLRDRVEWHKVTLDQIDRRPWFEIIVLKAPKQNMWDEGDYLDYRDDLTTTRYRSELAMINKWLDQADIKVVQSELLNPRHIPVQHRQMRRIFTRGSFKSGGRLFGGFWQSLSAEDRLKALRINGERVAELDFGQMAARIVYGMEGVQTNVEDLYAVESIHESYRSGLKQLFNAMLFTDKPLMRKPRDTKHLLPKDSVQTLTAKIEGQHPSIRHRFYRGIGHETQFIESQIIVELLLALREQGIIGLQTHDGLLVSRSEIQVAKDIMVATAMRIAGINIPVSVEMMD